MGTPGNRARRSSGGVPPPSAEGAQRAMSLWDIGAETAPLLSRGSTFRQRLVSGSSLSPYFTDSHFVAFTFSFGWETKRCQTMAWKASWWGVMFTGFTVGMMQHESATCAV